MKRAIFSFIFVAWLLSGCNNWSLQPPAPPTPTPDANVATPTPHFYVVQPGDTLWSISQKVGIDYNLLVKVNELENPDNIHPGDRLLISDKVTISGKMLPTPTPTPIPCIYGCIHPPSGCVIKGYQARLDGMKIYVMPGDEIYATRQAEVWFCREEDARHAGWLHWTPRGPK